MKKIFLLSLLIFNGCYDSDYKTEKSIDELFYENVILTENNNSLQDNIVFVGDSIARNFANYCLRYNISIGNLSIGNYGHGGYRMDNLVIEGIWRNSFTENPKYIVLNIGLNDVNAGIEIEKLKWRYNQMVINAQKTKSIIFLCTLVPEEVEGYEFAQQGIILLNEFIKSYQWQNNIVTIDVYNLLSENGHQIPEYFTDDPEWPLFFNDNIHPNCQGMEIIINKIKEYL